MHPFERRARQHFEDQAQRAADAIGCDIAHIITMASRQMEVLADSVEKGKADDFTDLRKARTEQDAAPREP